MNESKKENSNGRRSGWSQESSDNALGSQRWADEEEFEGEEDMNQMITEERDENGNIHKTVIESKKNEKGQHVKVIKKLVFKREKVKINNRVEARKKWRKFGECSQSAGPEVGITSISEEAFLESVRGEKDEKKQKKDVVPGVVCRVCQGDHWTVKCPYKDKPELIASRFPQSETDEKSSAPSRTPGTYVPPGMRGKEVGDSLRRTSRDEGATVRVTNLSEDTKEADLADLFRSFGRISRIFLAKDKYTGLSKGFAFINFENREDAARAIEKLQGYGYDHLILSVEWAKPSNK